jgi:hypothetical protein
MSGFQNWMLRTGPQLKAAVGRQTSLHGMLALLVLIVGWCLLVEALAQVSRLLDLYRNTARQLDAARGPGTARSEAIGMVLTLGLAALLALGLAIIGGA